MLTACLLLLPTLSTPHEDLAKEAAAVIEARCARCHGEGSEDQKAMRYWADAHDLTASLEVEFLLAAGDPGASDLWLVMEEGSMPPADSPEAPMPAEEVQLVQRWIEAGAVPPAAQPESPQEPETQAAEGQAEPEQAATAVETEDPGSPSGRLHPLLVHFPIALLTAALLAELLSILRLGQLRGTVRFCIWTGFLGAFAASWLGWSLADLQNPSGSRFDLTEKHRWYAVATLAAAFLSLIAVELRHRRESPGLLGRLAPLLLLLTGFLVSWAGHLGGKLSYGRDWLQGALPPQILQAMEWLDTNLP